MDEYWQVVGWMHDAQREVDKLRKRIAELEAERRPVAFAEREPDTSFILVWDTWQHTWQVRMRVESQLERDRELNIVTHWLPMPPAPEAQA